MKGVAVVSQFLRPFDACQMRSYAVSTRINQVANDHEACSSPIELVNRLTIQSEASDDPKLCPVSR